MSYLLNSLGVDTLNNKVLDLFNATHIQLMSITSGNKMQLCRSLSGSFPRGSVVCARPLRDIRLFRFPGLIARNGNGQRYGK